MVPLALAMHATAVLDRDLFNEEYEAEWRAHLKMRSDKNLSMLNPGIFCAGLQDRPARIMKAYADEIAARNMQACACLSGVNGCLKVPLLNIEWRNADDGCFS